MKTIKHPVKSSSCRPRDYLAAVSRRYPNVWKQSDNFRADRDGLPNWPDWCYLPFGGWYWVARMEGPNRAPVNLHEDIALLSNVAVLGALGAWRGTQGIYRFDPTLFESVVNTTVEGNLPCDVLHYLPEWCVYVETPGLQFLDGALDGFFAHLEWDAGNTELRFMLDTEKGLVPMALNLGPWSLAEALDRTLKSSYKLPSELPIDQNVGSLPNRTIVATESFRPIIEPMVSLLLYLCSQNAEIGDGSLRPANPTPKRTKSGLRLFAPDKPTTWDVGIRLGTAIRRAQSAENGSANGTHAGPRPHIRRAHWHGFRSGPTKHVDGTPIRTDNRKFTLRWLPPIPVNVDGVDELPATIRPVDTIQD